MGAMIGGRNQCRRWRGAFVEQAVLFLSSRSRSIIELRAVPDELQSSRAFFANVVLGTSSPVSTVNSTAGASRHHGIQLSTLGIVPKVQIHGSYVVQKLCTIAPSFRSYRAITSPYLRSGAVAWESGALCSVRSSEGLYPKSCPVGDVGFGCGQARGVSSPGSSDIIQTPVSVQDTLQSHISSSLSSSCSKTKFTKHSPVVSLSGTEDCVISGANHSHGRNGFQISQSHSSDSVRGISSQEAAASYATDEVVDWNQQHLRVREYDARPTSAVSTPLPTSDPDDIFIPVKAFYISRSVDLKGLAQEPFLDIISSRNNLIIRCSDRPPGAPVTADNPEMSSIGNYLNERYMVTFQYGSVVFFNFGDREEEESLDAVRKYCTDEFREARKDDYGCIVRPTLVEWSEGGHDRIMLRKLDTDNIRVISSILGQSIALDHYAKRVDEMVTTFSELNRGMEETGTFTMTRKKLFQLVAAANTTLADVILRLGLLERSDAAWKDANYAQIWEYLRDDFELDERFESLDFKLNIIQHNVRFFLEILQNRKSDTLEWIIILLITGEICVSLYDILHGAGAV